MALPPHLTAAAAGGGGGGGSGGQEQGGIASRDARAGGGGGGMGPTQGAGAPAAAGGGGGVAGGGVGLVLGSIVDGMVVTQEYLDFREKQRQRHVPLVKRQLKEVPICRGLTEPGVWQKAVKVGEGGAWVGGGEGVGGGGGGERGVWGGGVEGGEVRKARKRSGAGGAGAYIWEWRVTGWGFIDQ